MMLIQSRGEERPSRGVEGANPRADGQATQGQYDQRGGTARGYCEDRITAPRRQHEKSAICAIVA